ncbi:MAG: phospholipid carrier-dependent glycosyltransferase [Chloroflexi bacterium]|nr:phospholipid carrier-dependent glycosyltransferase [Chloroflexota bacterium]
MSVSKAAPSPKAKPKSAATSAATSSRPKSPTRASKELALARVTFVGHAVPYLLLVVGAVFVIWQVRHLHGYTYGLWHGNPWSDYDEGVYLTSARQLNNGHAIFSQVFSSQPMLFLAGLALTLQLGGGTPDAGHVYSLICGLFALGGVAWLCWEVGGRWSALLSTVLLALSPGFVIASHAIEAEAPMLAFGSLAVAASARYARYGERRWVAIACALLAAATLSKLLAVAIALPIVVAVLLKWLEFDRPGIPRRLLLDIGTGAACFVVPVAAVFALISPSAQWDQVISFHLKASEIYSKPPWLTANGPTFSRFFGWDPGLVAFAVAGVAVAAVLRRRLALIPIAWLIATLATLVRYHPLFIHHLTVLLAPLAALAGVVVAFDSAPKLAVLQRVAAGLLILCATVVYLMWLPEILDHSRSAFIVDANPIRASQATWLVQHSGPADTILVDDQMVAVAANRLVPPALTDTSTVRSLSGYLPLSLLTEALSSSHVRTVLLVRTLQYDKEFVQWLRAHYREVPLPAGYKAIAFVAPNT